MSSAAHDIEDLAAWIGREEVVEETLSATPVARLAATLDRRDAQPGAGEPLPPLAHWMYFVPSHPHADLAEDGHGRRGDFMPPVTLPRRMFAGARIQFLRPLRIGQAARRRGMVTDILPKQGRSGPLVFVKVRQEIEADGRLALIEEQDIVYRDAPGASQSTSASPPAPARVSEHHRLYLPDEATLFRYSALIFNAHRIHFDRPYAEGREGYSGLVVHGQLVATCLADLARREWGELSDFSFRALLPLFDGRPFTVHGASGDGGVRLWAADADGQITMEADARLR